MSLFEDARYHYRDTLFVFFKQDNRPSYSSLQRMFQKMGNKFEVYNSTNTGEKFESATVRSPQDYSAMDIVVVQGQEVKEQIKEMIRDFRTVTLTGEDRKKLKQLEECDCRFDIFHFGEATDTAEEDDEFLDPGGLLLLLERLSELTEGISFDPQSQALL